MSASPTDMELADAVASGAVPGDPEWGAGCAHRGVTSVPYGDTFANFQDDACDDCILRDAIRAAELAWEREELEWASTSDGVRYLTRREQVT